MEGLPLYLFPYDKGGYHTIKSARTGTNQNGVKMYSKGGLIGIRVKSYHFIRGRLGKRMIKHGKPAAVEKDSGSNGTENRFKGTSSRNGKYCTVRPALDGALMQAGFGQNGDPLSRPAAHASATGHAGRRVLWPSLRPDRSPTAVWEGRFSDAGQSRLTPGGFSLFWRKGAAARWRP